MQESGHCTLHVRYKPPSVHSADSFGSYTPLLCCLQDGNTPLHLAVLAGSLEMCDLLLARGSSPDILNEASMTPLMIAASENRVMITKNSLLKHPCNLLMQNRDGYTAADLALTHGNHGYVLSPIAVYMG